ncbi:uncharacterized protein BO97DRAFT_100095 [Aspergillus homomorphus CBS 101889]|uniref:Uncharacterized protein n=1 Tax=Aspergillus homomorphus (strain CBS 101889) TaxID=1450537 RepID=A0A395HUU0_ASPHC|nr:hypothetical protein BO97DRAFT_100095 [Aspergillus homomorphus CBS 101889]RAL11289.1 hypothetical protein BO97DRAFT_100095 [Aspergillus homomorphus CBS 101889]
MRLVRHPIYTEFPGMRYPAPPIENPSNSSKTKGGAPLQSTPLHPPGHPSRIGGRDWTTPPGKPIKTYRYFISSSSGEQHQQVPTAIILQTSQENLPFTGNYARPSRRAGTFYRNLSKLPFWGGPEPYLSSSLR